MPDEGGFGRRMDGPEVGDVLCGACEFASFAILR